jgi:hypothetical protein
MTPTKYLQEETLYRRHVRSHFDGEPGYRYSLRYRDGGVRFFDDEESARRALRLEWIEDNGFRVSGRDER